MEIWPILNNWQKWNIPPTKPLEKTISFGRSKTAICEGITVWVGLRMPSRVEPGEAAEFLKWKEKQASTEDISFVC